MAGILGLLGLGGGSQPAAAGVKPTDDWFAQFNPENKSPNGGINPNPGQAIPIRPSQDELNQQGQYAPPATPGQPSYADFQRDYWAPDREQVLAGMTPQQPMATSIGSGDLTGQGATLQGAQTLQGSMGSLPIQRSGVMGNIGNSLLQQGNSPFQRVVGQVQKLIQMRTPHGTMAQVPTSQIEEALRRGATQV